jgi:pilus assembly protein CpaE
MTEQGTTRTGNLRVIVIDRDELQQRTVAAVIEDLDGIELLGTAADPQQGMALITRETPDLLLLEIPDDAVPIIEMAIHLSAMCPTMQIIASAAECTPELLRQAMRAGIRELLERPFDAQEIEVALDCSRSLQLERENARLTVGETIAFFGAGGGLGTTTLAVNTAVLLARQLDSRVLVADLDLGGGDVPIFLDLDEPATTFLEILEPGRAPGSFTGLLATHRSGLHALAGPQRVEDLDAVNADDVARVMDLCRSAFGTIVVDAGHTLTDQTIAVLDRVDHVYLVGQLSLPALQGANRRLDLFRRLGYPPDRYSVILNRGHKHTQLSRREAERMLDTTIELEIASDYKATLGAIESGKPLVETRHGRQVSRSIEAIARRHIS